MPELIVFLRSRELSRVPIMMAETTIGRDASCDVVIDNAGVSRKHALVLYEGGQFVVRDLGSHNGITVNGKQVTESQLMYGDVLGINKFKVRFADSGGPPAELLVSPRQAAGKGPANVVPTMTVNADAAKRMQDEFIRRKQAAARENAKPPPARSAVNALLFVALLVTIAAIVWLVSGRPLPGMG